MARKKPHVKGRLDGIVLIGLGIALLLVLALSPFSSTSPDGLEKVGIEKGFAEKGGEWTLWKHAPLHDYTIPWIKNEKISIPISGLIGTLAIFLIAFGIGKLMRKTPTKKALLLMFFSCLISFSSITTYAARPLTTDDAWTAERGKFQLELGFDAVRQGQSRQKNQSSPDGKLRPAGKDGCENSECVPLCPPQRRKK